MSPLSPPIQAVLDLFQGPLAELHFADVNAAALAQSAHAVEAAAAAVAEREAQLTELRQTLTDRQDALLLLTQRAIAYARVYAEADEALTEQLSRITLPRASKPRKVNVKAAGSEPAVAREPAVAEAAAEPGADADTNANVDTDSPASDAGGGEAAAVRKGKRRASVTRDEAQSS